MKPFLKAYGPALLSGILLALAFPCWRLFPLAWIALVPLLWQARGLTPRACAARFFIAGWAFNSMLLHWLMTNVYWAGGWAFLGYQALCVLLSLYWAGLGFLWTWLRANGPIRNAPGILFVLWPVMEMIQARLFSGFGWADIGYSQGNDILVTQWASFGNVAFISAIVVLCNECIAFFLPAPSAPVPESPAPGKNPKFKIQNPTWFRSLRWQFLVAAIAVVALAHFAGSLLLGTPDYRSKPLNVGIIQSNFPIETKYDWEYIDEMVRNAAEKSRWLAQHEKVDLFVWPEAAIMNEISSPGTAKEIAALAKDTGIPLFAGASRHNEKTNGYPNSSYLFDKDGKAVDFYDKVHLVAFGEYVPFSEYLPFIQKVVPAIGEAEAGEEQKVFNVAGRKLGPLICFEVLFPNLSENLRKKGADFLTVITNLAWFGSSAAIYQEFELARMRAVETRLPLVHCSNTGISGVFDPWGRFEIIDAAFSLDGRYVKFDGRYTTEQKIAQRICGALPVPAPAEPPAPPGLVQWIFAAAAALLVLAATLRRTRGSKTK